MDPLEQFNQFYEEAITEMKNGGSLQMKEAIGSIVSDTTAANILKGLVCILVQKILENIYKDLKNKE